jgi:hypothetical protein
MSASPYTQHSRAFTTEEAKQSSINNTIDTGKSSKEKIEALFKGLVSYFDKNLNLK